MKIGTHKYKYQFAPAEKKLIAVYLVLGAIYAIASIYLLSTPIEDWAFNLGQYNQSILESFPKAQYWVNVSIAFREKVIPLYPLYQVFFWFVFVTAAISCIVHWRYYLIDTHKSRLIPICRRKKTILFGLVFFFSFLLLALTTNTGSEHLKLYKDLRLGLHGEYTQWNTTYGFVFYRLIAGIFGIGALVWLFVISIYSSLTCFTNLFNQQEQGG